MQHPDVHPRARTTNLIATQTGDALVVYDRDRHQIHQLNDIVAAVWHVCDGRRSVAEIADATVAVTDLPIDIETARLSLTELERANLLAEPFVGGSRSATQTRRRLLKRSAIAGVGAVPAIVSISAPVAAQAQSCADGCVDWRNCELGQCCMFDTGICGTCIALGSGSACTV